MQVQTGERVLLDAEPLLIQVTELLHGGRKLLLRRTLIPVSGFGVVHGNVIHAVGIDSSYVVLRLDIALFGQRQPTGQRQRAGGQIAHRVFTAARAAIDGREPRQHPRRQIVAHAAQLHEASRQLTVHYNSIRQGAGCYLSASGHLGGFGRRGLNRERAHSPRPCCEPDLCPDFHTNCHGSDNLGSVCVCLQSKSNLMATHATTGM